MSEGLIEKRTNRIQTVLVIDDDPMIHKLIPARLGRLDAEFLCASCGSEGLAMAQERVPDLILLDVSLPDVNGFTVCAQLASDRQTSEVPVIFLTGSDSRKEIRRAFDLGAVDYVTKPFDAEELFARVRAALRTQALLKALEQQASTDSLTGLGNRAAFYKAIGRSIDRSRCYSDHRFAILYMDLDRFKIINDSLGHAIGDDLLVTVANKLHRCVRSGRRRARGRHEDVVARMGGDEFAVLLDDIGDPETAITVARRVADTLAEPYELQGYQINAAASIGVKISQSPAETADDLMRDADTAMYNAKEEGTGQVVVFDAEMYRQAVDRLEFENDLAEALEREEFTLLYQPIVSLRTGEMYGVEALVRWQHPERGLVPPDRFISIAEETGLIVDLGTWVLREACARAADWHRRFPRESLPVVSVNLSKVQLKTPSLVDDVRAILKQTGLAADRLKLEVTESVIMHDTRAIVPVLDALRDLGAIIAMDDFGTGYSSLASLQKFPIDVLKIDRSFVKDMSGSRTHAAIVYTIVTLAEQLDIQVVAEGVETEDHLVQLQAMDCSYAQGYLFSKPVAAEKIEALLAKANPFARAA